MTSPARSRRADIQAAAEREFAAAGFAGGRIERIAATAGVNKQLLFHYFGSKEGLFLTALQSLLARHEWAPAAAGIEPHPAEQIRSLLTAVQSAIRAVPGLLGILADSRSTGDFPPDALRLLRRWRADLLARLTGAIEEGQRRGYFRDDIDPAAVAAISLAAGLGVGALAADGEHLPLGNLVADYCAWR